MTKSRPIYAELHCKTNFSFLEGASHAEELCQRAKELNYFALAVTDRASLAGIVRAHGAAKEHGLRLVVGVEVHLDDAPPVLLWPTDRAAYGRLCRLLTLGRRRAPKGQCRLTFDDVSAHSQGMLAGLSPPDEWTRPDATNDDAAHEACGRFLDLFGDRGHLMAELFRGLDDDDRLRRLAKLATKTRLPLVASGDVHYHAPARMALHDVLTCVRHGTTLSQAEGLLFPNAQRHLKDVEQIAARFAEHPEAVARTLAIAGACRFSLDELRYEYPEELAPQGLTPLEHLRNLANQGAAKRYPQGVPAKVRQLLDHELTLIAELRYEAYFLTVWDLVRFARSRGILCQGRGSAANSAVCYCLGVTSVDPTKTDLLFERFVSRERNEAPDIDVDFEHERREEVLQYLYEKYGRERAGLTAVVTTYRTRSAIRDVGKALGLSLDRVDDLAKQIETFHFEPRLAQRMRETGLDPESELGRRFVYCAKTLEGFPRHLSQHVGGMVVTRGPLCELAPIENAAMPGRTVIEWNKDDLDELGILKVDCLCLGMLTAIRKCFELIERHHGRRWTLATIPPEEPDVYDMICRADTIGVFQIESRAQMSMLPRLKPRCWYDLVIEVAIVRPGPIQGQMVHPYLRRRCGEEEPTYPSPEIREALRKTLGVPLFQEQAMRLAVVAAGFTPGEADQLRRAMGAWRKPGLIEQFRVKLVEGMKAKGLSDQFAEQVFNQIRGFGEYGFPESHAASFALLVYASAWLKKRHPAEYCAALLNSQPMGFYAPAQLVRDARDHGVEVRPIDVQFSDWDCTIEPARDGRSSTALRLGMRLLTGMKRSVADSLVAVRNERSFASIEDFSRRAGVDGGTLRLLADADALASLEVDRRAALWKTLAYDHKPKSQPLFAALAANEPDEPAPAELPPMALFDQVLADYRRFGLSLKGHPIAFFRRRLAERKVARSRDLETIADGSPVRVGGLVILRQRPQTAKGITFVTIEDESGAANLVVRPQVWERFYAIARRSPAWLVHGKLERKDRVIHVVVNRIEDLSEWINGLATTSRDFR